MFSANVLAERALHAHEHGAIVLEVGIEGKMATFSVDGPAESFLGFEYVAKTTKEKKVFNEAKKLWSKNFFELVSFDKALECKLSGDKFEQKVEKKEGVHSDVEASMTVSCSKDLKGAKLLVNLKKHFKNIKKLKMELVGNETKSIDIKSDSFEVNL